MLNDPKLFDMIENLADKLGVTAEKLLAILSHGVFIDGIGTLLSMMFVMMISVSWAVWGLYVGIPRGAKSRLVVSDDGTKRYHEAPTGFEIFGYIGVVVCIICFFIGIFVIRDSIIKIGAPESVAITNIINYISQ